MKVRESGMPPLDVWRTFFIPERVLRAMRINSRVLDAADLGCGYGTFTIPAASRIRGKLHAFDIDRKMTAATRRAARQAGVKNIRIQIRDFMSRGTGLPDCCVSYVMLFNILHARNPVRLLREAWRVLVLGGRVGVIHWNPDPATPRGPSMAIRPRPADCRKWMRQTGFKIVKTHIDLPPYHYGILAIKEHC